MTDHVFVMAILGVLTICAGGFYFLAAWLWRMNADLDKMRVEMKDLITFRWFETVYEPKASTQLDKLIILMEKLEGSMLGTLDKKGIIGRISEHEDRIGALEKKSGG